MRWNRLCGTAAIAGAALAWPAAADFVVDLGSGTLAGGETRFVELDVPGQFMVGFEITFDYTPGAGAEWASDMAFWVDDAAGSPSVQIGGFNVLFANEQGAVWGFDGAGSAAAGTYSDSKTLIHSGDGIWRFSIGNGWSASGGATYDNVIVTVITGDAGACGDSTESCTTPHATPGCNNAGCCVQVCEFEPFCCAVEWDEFCVVAAVDICGLYVYDCPGGGPANDCPTNATVVEDGDSLPFNTTNANTTAPNGCEDYDPTLYFDVWYQFNAPANGVLTMSTCDTADFDTKGRGYDIGDGTFDPNTLPDRVIACNDDGAGCSGFTSILTFQVEAGVSYLVALGGFLNESGSGTVAFTFTPEAAGCGDPAAGNCCEPQPLPYCSDGACCETVCAIDAFCCDSQWDGFCANLAVDNCIPLCGVPVPPQTCSAPGANPLDSNNNEDLTTGGVACAPDDVTAANTYARVFTQSELGGAYSFSCVNFGLNNSGGYLEGEIGVWIDENGGAPSVNDVVLLQSYPVGLYPGEDQLVTVTGDSLCVELTGDQTLVVTLSIPQALIGFATFAGGTSSNSETYFLSPACGITEFDTLTSIGFPDTHWFVQLSGNIGCQDGIIGDLNLDGVVNGADLTILLSAWGTSDPVADLNGDGTVNGADLTIQLSNWTG